MNSTAPHSPATLAGTLIHSCPSLTRDLEVRTRAHGNAVTWAAGKP
jgi:hypothetical protein